jgi:hypothetical protein
LSKLFVIDHVKHLTSVFQPALGAKAAGATNTVKIGSQMRDVDIPLLQENGPSDSANQQRLPKLTRAGPA